MNKPHKNLIVLAGGSSSRMKKPSTTTNLSNEETVQSNQRSKGLIGLDSSGRPFMDYLLFNAKNAGYRNIFIVISPKEDLFKELYGDKVKGNSFHGLQISYALQHIPLDREKPLGTADAVLQAMEQFPELQKDSFTVCNCDNLYSVKALEALRLTKSSNALIAYNRDSLKFNTERISRFAILQSKNGLLETIIEKPGEKEVEQFKDENGNINISMNIFKFNGVDTYKYFKECPLHPERNEKEIPTVLKNYISVNGNKITLIPFSEHVPDLTSKEDIPVLKKFINKHYGQLNWEP